MRSLRGQPVVVTFLYTTCQDSCPIAGPDGARRARRPRPRRPGAGDRGRPAARHARARAGVPRQAASHRSHRLRARHRAPSSARSGRTSSSAPRRWTRSTWHASRSSTRAASSGSAIPASRGDARAAGARPAPAGARGGLSFSDQLGRICLDDVLDQSRVRRPRDGASRASTTARRPVSPRLRSPTPRASRSPTSSTWCSGCARPGSWSRAAARTAATRSRARPGRSRWPRSCARSRATIAPIECITADADGVLICAREGD